MIKIIDMVSGKLIFQSLEKDPVSTLDCRPESAIPFSAPQLQEYCDSSPEPKSDMPPELALIPVEDFLKGK
jgi:hypothetical protein